MPKEADMPERIPFNRASLVGNELAYVRQAIDQGHISGNGPFTQKVQSFLQEKLGVAKVILTTSCTHALEMAAMLLDIHPGDEVIVPSFTFVSTVNAFVVRGARPVFVDIRPDTLNLDESQLEQRITPRTRAIVPVHYAGVGCEMDAITDIAARHGVPVIEDCAHGLFGRYKGRYLGTFGALAALSFHETKNFTCGEGGALLIEEQQFSERAEVLRDKGTDRSRFFRGEVERYTWVDIGSSYAPSDILAAFLWGQLEAWVEVQQRRRRIWYDYADNLRDWAAQVGARLPSIPPVCDPSFHLFYLLMPTPESRKALIAHLAENHIMAVFHYQPLHCSSMGRRFGGQPGDCPVTEWVSDRLLRLPFYYDLSEAEQMRVVEAIRAFR